MSTLKEPKRTPGKTTAKKNFGVDELSSILEMIEQYNLSEFELERGGDRLKLSREIARPNGESVQPMYAPVAPMPMMSQQMMPVQGERELGGFERSPETPAPVAQPEAVPAKPAVEYKQVNSPMVGTFYRRPAVDAEPYVKVGDIVGEGDVLCIIEAMKLMNEIESSVSGRIVEICLEDGQMAEYGEVLFRIEPV